MNMQMYKLFLFRHIPFVCHIYGKGTAPLCKKVAKAREYPKYDYKKISSSMNQVIISLRGDLTIFNIFRVSIHDLNP